MNQMAMAFDHAKEREKADVGLRVLRSLHLARSGVVTAIPFKVALLRNRMESHVTRLLVGHAAPRVHVERREEHAEVSPRHGSVG